MSKAFSNSTKDLFKFAGVDVVICADQTFIRFRLAKEKVLVPTGIKRVGTTTESNDERKGVTLMLSAYVEKNCRTGKLSAGVLPPFFVFNGVTGAILDKRYKDWCKRPGHSGSMNFQKKHWFDKIITLRWVNWFVNQFLKGKTLGLVWDACPAHLAGLVQARLRELQDQRRLYVADIPKGLTSILQLGDICLNGPCKNSLKKSYLSFTLAEVKRRRALGETGKLVVKVTREQLMTWAQDFVDNFIPREKSGMSDILIPCLSKVGQNIFSNESESFTTWLKSLTENAVYKALLNKHIADDLV